MLAELHLRNLAVLAGANVEFGPGLNVLTGETGAGKSIVVDGLALLSGARASAELVRAGAEQLLVTGIFRGRDPEVEAQLAAAGIEPEGDELVVRREIGREGRNRVFLNDQPATLRLLSELAPRRLRLHGQREELGLAAPDLQRVGAAAALRAKVGEGCREWRALAARLALLRGDQRARAERLELLRYQLAELVRVNPGAGEEEELHRERGRLRHREAIARSLAVGLELLADGEGAASDQLGAAREALREAARFEPAAAGAGRLLTGPVPLPAAGGGELRAALPADDEPGRLDRVEERLCELERLVRRHAVPADALPELRQRLAMELEQLGEDEGNREGLEAACAEALAGFTAAAAALSRARADWGEELARALARELADLALPRARFAVRLERRLAADSPLALEGRPIDFGPLGYDSVVFEFSPNPGEGLRPLARIASGGELSRVYLALQLAARGEEGAGGATLVFDEVDAGVGGAQAAAVGRKLQRLATHGQILAVTHLPQVASHADRHFLVEKRVRQGRTFAEVRLLTEEERIEELARMLGGARVTASSRAHAAELLAGARRRER